jgi:hypothetical protein
VRKASNAAKAANSANAAGKHRRKRANAAAICKMQRHHELNKMMAWKRNISSQR